MRRGIIVSLLLVAACGGSESVESTTTTSEATTTTSAAASTTTVAESAIPTAPPETTTTTAATTTTTISPFARPDWLGLRLLQLRDDGFGENLPTPDELQGRAFETIDFLPPPETDEYIATVSEVPAEVAGRSTWHDDCPVDLGDLRYLTMTHWGFDGKAHTGEMIVHAEVADDVVGVFATLFAAGFPIEQMRVIAAEELDAPPTGDGNDTTGFVCRPVVTTTTTWSQHAYGLAVDINPFHNPYEKGDLVLPELATYYTDRSLMEPGMIIAGDVVTQAFADIGWGWGGNWNSLDDYMHFSRNGR